jgi:hypothetical protein
MAERDETRVREQPTLTTSNGTIWLVVGGIFAAISIVMLVAMTVLPNGVVALVAALVVAVLYVGMIAARVLIPPGRRRLGVLAGGMLLMAAVAFLGVALVAFAAWDDAADRIALGADPGVSGLGLSGLRL